MKYAPENATWVIGLMRDGSIDLIHFAQDLSGEEQPPFSGWFRACIHSSGFYQIDPVAWKPIPQSVRTLRWV